MTTILLASEVANLINFLVLDIGFLSLIMFASGRLAGYVNHNLLQQHDRVHLTNFDVPLIGGGLVMQRGWQRTTFIALRISVVVAVALCNFGLEGRSQTVKESETVTVRSPGTLNHKERPGERVRWVERQMRCGNMSRDDRYEFGPVLGTQCWQNLTDADAENHVYVHEMGLGYKPELNMTFTECNATPRCRRDKFDDSGSTLYQCKEADVVCRREELDDNCLGDVHHVKTRTCMAVVYAPDSKSAKLCDHAFPFGSGYKSKCKYIKANREDIENWRDYYPRLVKDVTEAIFMAAYAQETSVTLSFRGPVKSVTVIRVWWTLPAAWVVLVAFMLTLWLVLALRKGTKRAAHDERGLTALVGGQLSRSNGDFDDGVHHKVCTVCATNWNINNVL